MSEQTAEQRLTFETQVGKWRDLLEVLGAINPEHRLHFDADGIGVTTVDPANVAVVDMAMAAESFDSFEAAGDGELGLPGDRMRTSMPLGYGGGVSRRDDVAVSIDAEETRVEIKDRNDGYVNRTITLGTLTTDSMREPPDTEKFEGREWRVGIPARDFVNAINAFDEFRIDPWFEVCEDGLRLRGEKGKNLDGPHGRKAIELTIQGETDAIGDGHSDGAATSLFGRDYLADIADAIEDLRTSVHVVVEFGEEVPAKIGLETPGDAEWTFDFAYYVAPRLQSDEGDSDAP